MLKKLFSSELGKGALILFVMMNIFNVFSFLFHFLMGRFLGPVDYRVLGVLMMIIAIYGIPTEAIQNIISRYTSKLNLKKEKGKIKFLLFKSLKKGFKISLIVFILATVISIFLAEFLKIEFYLIFLTNIFLLFAFLIPVTRGVLQGRKKFTLLGSSLVLESGLKLIFGVSFVIFGWKVFGATAGVLLSIIAGFIFSLSFNKEILNSKEEKVSFDGIYSLSMNYFIVILVVFFMYSLDIFLVIRFFSPELSGKYTVLSMLGKIIFLGTFAISKAMFPLTSERKDENKNSFGLFKKYFIIIFIMCFVAVLLYGFFPKLIIGLLYGSQYVDVSSYLIYCGIAFSFLSLTNLILIYGLSINRIRNCYPLIGFVILTITLLFIFNSTLMEYVIAFMLSNIIMFIGSLFFIVRRK